MGWFHGAENGTRTRDPQLGKLMLYQLSYFRMRFGGSKVVKVSKVRNKYLKTIDDATILLYFWKRTFH